MQPPTFQILIIDDNPDESSVYGWYLSKIKDFKCALEYADNGAAGLKKVAAKAYDLVILDFQMPGMNGLEVLTKLRQSGSEVPVVMMTGGTGERVAVESLKQGAIDYVLKEDLPKVDFAGLIRRAIEMAVLKAEKKDLERVTLLKNEFLELLTRDLQAPLVTMFGVIEMLEQERLGSLNSSQKDGLGSMMKEAQRLYDLIEDLVNLREFALDYKDLARRRLSLTKLVRERLDAHRRFFDDKSIAIETSFVEEALDVEGDPARLQCVVDNVLSNALRWTPFGGKLGVLVRRGPDGAAEAGFADNGAGIAPEQRARLFEKFFHSERRLGRRFDGLGIGLAVSRHIVEAHRGTLAVHSEGPDRGTQVTLHLPPPGAGDDAVPAPAAAHKA